MTTSTCRCGSSRTKSGLEVLLYARNLLSQQVPIVVQVGGDETGGSNIMFGKERESYGISITKRF